MEILKGSEGSKDSLVAFFVAGCAVMGVMVAGPVEAQQRAEPSLSPTDESESDFVCTVPADDVSASVRAKFAEYHECVQPYIDEWLEQYPEEVGQLEEQYQAWRTGLDHDLRYRDGAEQIAGEFPVDFSSSDVELSDSQIEAASPQQADAGPAAVPGAFQRLFVDRGEDRLFLSSATDGLVSLDISERYDFEVQGSTEIDGEDFFVVDANTAVMEEESAQGHARDLVILDISNRADPQEITRLEGALPRVRSLFTGGGGSAR